MSPRATKGRLLVKTAHSRYVIDQDAGTFHRTPEHELATPSDYLRLQPGVFRPYEDLHLEVGDPLYLTLQDGRTLRSTPVQSITAAGE